MEWIEAIFDDGPFHTRREIGSLEHSSDLRTSLFRTGVVRLRSHCLGLGLCDGPFRSESTFTDRERRKTFDVILVPKKELEVLGGMLDVDKVIHEIPGGTWLDRYEVSTILPESSSSLICSHASVRQTR